MELENEKLAEKPQLQAGRDKDGNVVANIINVFGQDVEVSDEVFAAYSQMDRRARYIGEDIPAEGEISLERTIEDGIHIETLENAELSAEKYCLLEEEAEHEAKMLDELPKVIESLPESDKKLIKALYYDGYSTREYAQKLGITQTAMLKRRNRILKYLKKYFEKF